MRLRTTQSILFLAIAACLMAPAALAQAPTKIPFQGLILDDVGTPLNASVDLDFAFFNSLTGGTLIWSETHNGVIVVDGVYSVNLGESNPVTTDLLSAGPVYLEITVSNDVLTPRQQLLPVPYALVAGSVGGASETFIQEILNNFAYDGEDPPNMHPDEGTVDTDGDGQVNFLDSDNDNDGVSDGAELALGRPINIPNPMISQVFPNIISIYDVVSVRITGLGLETVASVTWGSENATPYNVTPTEIWVDVVTETSAPSQTLTVTLANAESDQKTLMTTTLPNVIVNSFLPAIGRSGQASTVQISGDHFYPGMTVDIGGQSYPSTFVSETEITVDLPAQSVGAATLTVNHPNGSSANGNYYFVGPNERIAFVSTFKMNGAGLGLLGGIQNAHNQCQTSAANADLTGTYRAWASLSLASGANESPATTFTKTFGPYRTPDFDVIANDWTDLTDGTLQNPIDVRADGSPDNSFSIWTGTHADGTAVATAAESCNDWTSQDASDDGLGGSRTVTNSTWTDKQLQTCITFTSYYCFEQ